MNKKYDKDSLLKHLGFDQYTEAEERFFNPQFKGALQLSETRPTTSSDDNRIRASFLREVILGNIETIDLPEGGLILVGAWIEGALNLSFCKISIPLTISSSHFSDQINLIQSQTPALNLNNSELQSITADGIKINGSVFLKDIKAHGEVRFLGAEINGNFESENAQYFGKDRCFSADRIKINGSVLLKSIQAHGEVRFVGAEINGQFVSQNSQYLGEDHSLTADGIKIGRGVFLENVKAHGEVNFLSAKISGEFNCRDAEITAKLSLQNAQIGGASLLEFKKIGALDLTGAILKQIIDKKDNCPKKGSLSLDGATYQGFAGNAPNDAASRLEWLDLNHQFSPQPYRQLAKVFRSEGKTRDANQVLYVMEDKLAKNYREEFEASKPEGWSKVQGRASITADNIFKSVTGYGYQNYKALIWLSSLIGILFVFSFIAYHMGQMVPNSDVILTSYDFHEYYQNPKDWVANSEAGKDWETFSPLFYSADVVIPLIDFSQEDTWSPSKSRGAWGESVWFLRWPFKIMGWIIATIGLASMTGFLQTRHNE